MTNKVTATENDGEWVLGFTLNENLDELCKQAVAMRNSGRKIEAMRLVRECIGVGLKEARTLSKLCDLLQPISSERLLEGPPFISKFKIL